jgi:hypothetical protein
VRSRRDAAPGAEARVVVRRSGNSSANVPADAERGDGEYDACGHQEADELDIVRPAGPLDLGRCTILHFLTRRSFDRRVRGDLTVCRNRLVARLSGVGRGHVTAAIGLKRLWLSAHRKDLKGKLAWSKLDACISCACVEEILPSVPTDWAK